MLKTNTLMSFQITLFFLAILLFYVSGLTMKKSINQFTDDILVSDSFRVLGVCGGIGSGKSTACKLLVSDASCLKHIDADSVAHSVYSPGSQLVQDVANVFGKTILLQSNNVGEQESDPPMEIDRKKLGKIVFSERSAMAKLEEIVWPRIRSLLIDEIGTLRQKWEAESKELMSKNTRPIVILEAAVLIDAGWDDLVDGIWVISAPRETALSRLIETRGLTEEEAGKRIDAQESRRGITNIQDEIDANVITCEVNNDGSLDDLIKSLKVSLNEPKCWKR